MPDIHKLHKRCCGCGKLIVQGYSHTIYCPRCSGFAIRLAAKRFPPETVKDLWEYVRQYGYVCYYTRMALDMEDFHSPWYCTFDHWSPRNPGKMVITSSLLNEMKCTLTEDEFWYMIKALAKHRRHHTPIRKIKLTFWPGHADGRMDLGFMAGMELEAPVAGKRCCAICGKRLVIWNAKYCPRCAKFALRLHSKGLPPETIENTLNYIRKYGFRCFYTGILLDLDNPKSPWYCALDHWIPQNPGKIVLTCDLFNVMKSDLSEKEFWHYVEAFADFKEKGKKVRRRKLVYWWRLYPLEDGVAGSATS